jgi:hypothetical protein
VDPVVNVQLEATTHRKATKGHTSLPQELPGLPQTSTCRGGLKQKCCNVFDNAAREDGLEHNSIEDTKNIEKNKCHKSFATVNAARQPH